MQPPQPPQFHVTERLDTETEAIDAGRTKSLEGDRSGGLGVRLQRDLGPGIEVAPISSGSSSDGVPPPKKIVSTPIDGVCAHCLMSATRAST